jgi:hypothetical protein
MQIHRFSFRQAASILIPNLHAKEPPMEAVPTVTLPARQLFEITDASGVRILCTAGSLWLTLDHDQRDVILQPGDSFEAASRRRVLLYAFEPSTFALAAAPQRSVRRSDSKNRSDCMRSPSVWAATRAASPG